MKRGIQEKAKIATALAFGALLFFIAVWLHLCLLALGRKLLRSDKHHAARVSGAFLIVLVSHLLIAALFAVGFYMAAQAGLGGFKKHVMTDWMDYFYFSLINITTLGLGDVYPTGHLRAMTGIESLTGFLLISCTAQFVYQATKQKEDSDGRQ